MPACLRCKRESRSAIGKGGSAWVEHLHGDKRLLARRWRDNSSHPLGYPLLWCDRSRCAGRSFSRTRTLSAAQAQAVSGCFGGRGLPQSPTLLKVSRLLAGVSSPRMFRRHRKSTHIVCWIGAIPADQSICILSISGPGSYVQDIRSTWLHLHSRMRHPDHGIGWLDDWLAFRALRNADLWSVKNCSHDLLVSFGA